MAAKITFVQDCTNSVMILINGIATFQLMRCDGDDWTEDDSQELARIVPGITEEE